MVKLSERICFGVDGRSGARYAGLEDTPVGSDDVAAIREAVRALEVELEQVKGERDSARAEIEDRADTEASLAQELYDCIGERDAYEQEMDARGKSLADVAAERDALVVKLEKSRALFLRLNTAANSQLSHDLSAEGVNLCCSAQMPCPAPSGTPPKTEQQEADMEQDLESIHEDVINQRIATALEACIEPLYAELEHGDAGHRIWLRAKFEDWFRKRVATYGVPTKSEAHPRATTPVSGSSASQPSAEPFRVTGPGFYRQRDGGKAEVAGYNSKHGGWNGRYADDESQAPIDMCWYKDGRASCLRAQDPYDLVAPWVEPAVEEEFEIVERPVSLFRTAPRQLEAFGYDEGDEQCKGFVAKAVAEFRIPRPAKPKVSAEIVGKYVCLAVESSQDGDAFTRTIDREQAIALRDALVAAKLDGEGKGEG